MKTRNQTWLPRLLAGLFLLFSAASCDEFIGFPKDESHPSKPVTLRFATYNASLNRFSQGQLLTDLSTPGNAQARQVAEVIQRVRPDVLALLEFDYDAAGEALSLFRTNYLSVGQNGGEPIAYPYAYAVPSNTGVLSDYDFNNSGNISLPDDAYGFGFFPGQYAFVVLSKYPIQTGHVRTFQHFLWRDMPGAKLPVNPDGTAYYSEEELAAFRLSSKNHVDVPVELPGGRVVHALVAHPTPPVFDGPEDRNGTRNFDEIRLLNDYVKGEGYLVDDRGVKGGLAPGARFVIMGDMNADPNDGDATDDPISTLFFNNPRINPEATTGTGVPSGEGGAEAAQAQGGVNLTHTGNPAFDTSDFTDGPGQAGNLRVDYVLPSTNLPIKGSGIFWPTSTHPLNRLTTASDHLMVWTDVKP